VLMYVKAARERDALIHTEVDAGVVAVELANAEAAGEVVDTEAVVS
jgi:hypothetical protein